MKPNLDYPKLRPVHAPAPGTKCGLLTSPRPFEPWRVAREAETGAAVRFPSLPQRQTSRAPETVVSLPAGEAGQVPATMSSPGSRASVRLPSPSRHKHEGYLEGLLVLLSLLAVGREFWATFQSADNWHYFVEFVRHLFA